MMGKVMGVKYIYCMNKIEYEVFVCVVVLCVLIIEIVWLFFLLFENVVFNGLKDILGMFGYYIMDYVGYYRWFYMFNFLLLDEIFEMGGDGGFFIFNMNKKGGKKDFIWDYVCYGMV